MDKLLDVRLACCDLNRKRLRAEVKRLSTDDKLEFIAENTDVIKDQIHDILREEKCITIEVNEENGSVHMMVKRSGIVSG